MFSIKIIEGDDSTKDKVLELTYTGTSPILDMNNTIEIVSGPVVTHNGVKGSATVCYNAIDDKDYSSLRFNISQEEKGTSIIRSVCFFDDEVDQVARDDWDKKRLEHLKNDPNREAIRDWEERYQVALGFGEEFTESSPELAWPDFSTDGWPPRQTFTTEEISITYK